MPDGWICRFEVGEESSNFARAQRNGIGKWEVGTWRDREGIGEEERYAMTSGQRGRLSIGSR